jgi:hypothetical protein
LGMEPSRDIGIVCCARATSGQAAAAPRGSDMNSRRFNAQYLPCFEKG